MIEVGAGAKAGRQSCEASRISLVGDSSANANEERIAAVYDVIAANVEVIPILNQLSCVFIVVINGEAIRVARMGTIWLGESFNVGKPNGVEAITGNDVGLRTAAHELQPGARVQDRISLGVARTRGGKQLGKVSLTHQIGGDGGVFRRAGDFLAKTLVIAE